MKESITGHLVLLVCSNLLLATVRDETLKQLNLCVTCSAIFILCLYNGSVEGSLFLFYRRERPSTENGSPKVTQCVICIRETSQFGPHYIPWPTVCRTWLCPQDWIWSKISLLQRGNPGVGQRRLLSLSNMNRSTEASFGSGTQRRFEVVSCVLKIQKRINPMQE